jgi:hypothetical protein
MPGFTTTVGAIAGATLLASFAHAAPRDIQMRSVNLATSVVELHNFGAGTETLTGWRFCTHDEDQSFRYSSPGGLDGVSIPAGGSFFVHFNNDAPGANSINIAGVGGIGGAFALPIDGGTSGDAFGLGLYINSSFNSGSNIADHVQWSFGGIDNTTADERSDEAVVGLVWNSEVAWISTAADTENIELINPSAGGAAGSSNINSPADYEVQATAASCEGDANGDLTIDVNDISFVLFRLGQNNGVCGDGDPNGDGVNDVNDISYVLFRLGTCNAGGPCP